MSKITRLELHEWMKVELAEMDFPSSGAISIGGANGSGKTSLKQFLEAAFGGKNACPDMPVRKGEKKALGKLTLDDEGRCVTVEVEVGEDREMRAVVRQAGGPPFKAPATMLKAMVNGFSFDPFAMFKLTGRPFRDKLLECLGVDFNDLEAKAEEIKAERTRVGRDVHGRETLIAGMPEYAGVPAEEQSASELAGKMQEGMKTNENRRKWVESLAEWEQEIGDAKAEVDRLKAALKAAEARVNVAEGKAATAKSAVTALKEIDLAPLRAALDNIDAINKKVRANKQRAAAVEQFRADHEKYAELGEALKAIDGQKQARLASAKAPVDGLTFTDDGVFFHGLPLNQESGSGQMIRAVELVAALNPKLRCICIDDGERLMQGRLEELDAWAIAKGFQVFIFRASVGQECEFIMVDGHVGTAAEVEEARKAEAVDLERHNEQRRER